MQSTTYNNTIDVVFGTFYVVCRYLSAMAMPMPSRATALSYEVSIRRNVVKRRPDVFQWKSAKAHFRFLMSGRDEEDGDVPSFGKLRTKCPL